MSCRVMGIIGFIIWMIGAYCFGLWIEKLINSKKISRLERKK